MVVVVVVPSTRGRNAGSRAVRPVGRVLLATVQFGLLALAVALIAAHFALGLSLHGVLSDSMRPTFSAGDYLVVLDQDPTSLRTGQVPLLMFPDGTTRAHRIVDVDEARGTLRLLTRGDANSAADPWSVLDSERAVPVVIGVLPAAPAVFEALRAIHAHVLLAAAIVGLGGVGFTTYVIHQQYVRLRDCGCDDCTQHLQANETQETR